MPNPSPLEKYKPTSDDFEFRQYPFYWLMKTSNRYSQEMESRLKLMGVNITNWRIGLILKHYGSISMTEISQHAVTRLPTVNKSVYSMQDQGLVSVSRSETDARVTMVRITDKGLETVEKLIQNTSKIVDRAYLGFSEKEIHTLNQLLQRLYDNLS